MVVPATRPTPPSTRPFDVGSWPPWPWTVGRPLEPHSRCFVRGGLSRRYVNRSILLDEERRIVLIVLGNMSGFAGPMVEETRDDAHIAAQDSPLAANRCCGGWRGA